MTTNLKLIMRIEDERANKVFALYFFLLNIILILTSIGLGYLENEIYFEHFKYHLLILILIIFPIRIAMIKIDNVNFFKYILLVLFGFYIFSIAFVTVNESFYIILMLSYVFASLIYISRAVYIGTSIFVFGTIIGITFSNNSTNTMNIINIALILAVVLIMGYYALNRVIELLDEILSDSDGPFIDKLTGTYSKHYLKEKIANISYGGEIQLSIISLDIDNFKEINSKYGFNAGDLILQGFTSIVQKILRNSDSIFRNEGDNFIIIVQHPKEFESENLAERIRLTLENESFSIIDKNDNVAQVKITASFGVATLREGESSDELLSRADSAMKLAKKNGKNTIERFE